MILAPDVLYDQAGAAFCYPSARQWQSETLRNGMLPLIGIAGTRGKSTVLRLIESVLASLRFRVATWTDLGVQISGRNQRAELAGWSRAMRQLAEGTIDLGLQELDWAAVKVAGLPTGMYPVMVHTGLQESAASDDESVRLKLGLGGTLRCLDATNHDGLIVANADDGLLMESMDGLSTTTILVTHSRESRHFRHHMASDGLGVWVEDGMIWIGSRLHATRFGRVTDFPITFGGEASFNVKNVMLALGTLHAMGVDLPPIQRAFRRFRAAWEILPASMNLYEYRDARAAIDQLAPHWVLRDVLKVLNPAWELRQLTVVGDLGWIEDDEVFEVGKLLGRSRGAIILHGKQNEQRLDLFRKGIASNLYPPPLSMLPTERRAINRAFKSLRPSDVLVILTTRDSAAAHRAVRRHLSQVE